jgi:hypothetical protein
VKILQQQGNQQIFLPQGLRLEKKDGQLELYSPSGTLLQRLAKDALIIEDDVALVQGFDLQKASEDMDQSLIRVLISSTDNSALARLPGGIDIEVRSDNSAVIRTDTGEVLLVDEDRKVYIFENGKFVPLPGGKHGRVNVDEAGTVSIGKLKISDRDITFDGGNINLNDQSIKFHNGSKGQRSVQLGQQSKGVCVVTTNQTVSAFNEAVKTIMNAQSGEPAQQWSLDLAKKSFESRDVYVGMDETRIKHADGRADTIIKADNTVIFEGARGPILHRDGSMRFDEQTYVDSRGNVTSGDWHAATAYSGTRTDSNQSNNGIENAAAQTASHASSAAMSVYGKASAGVVTMSDIDALSQSLGDVTALISQLSAAGRMDLAAQLQNARGIIIQAINFALPKAQAAQALQSLTTSLGGKQNAA